MHWLHAADACQLDVLRTGCLVQLAQSLAGWGGNLASSLPTRLCLSAATSAR